MFNQIDEEQGTTGHKQGSREVERLINIKKHLMNKDVRGDMGTLRQVV